MRVRMLVVSAIALAFVLPAQARSAGFSGVVVAKQPQRGTMLIAGARGIGLTVRGGLKSATVGEKVALRGTRLRDGTVRVSSLRVVAHVRRATVRGAVLRKLARGTLLASGRSVVLIHQATRQTASAADHHGLRSGDLAEFRIRFDDDELFEVAPPQQVGQDALARIEGRITSLSPFVVATEEAPLTITVPAGMTLPAGLAIGQRIELTVQVGANNTFTLVAIDDEENVNPAQAHEVEVKGLVSSSTTSQVVVNVNGTLFTFNAPTGITLPVLPTGTFVEARGVDENGTITLTRLRTEDDGDGDGGGGGDGGGDG